MPRVAKAIHPENLKIHQRYRFYYKNCDGKEVTDEGKFLRMEACKDPKCLWLYFDVGHAIPVPFDYHPDMKFLSVGENYEE